MTAEVKKIEDILGSNFSIDNFVALIGEIFSSARTVSPYKQYKEYSNFSSHIVGYSHVANYATPDDKKLIILAVELQKDAYVETSRSTQRSYVKKLIESSSSDAAVVAFYTTGETKWRLSFVRLDYEMKFENGKLKASENITPAKRYSFLVGKDEPSHTAIERLHSFISDKNSQPTLDELEEVFSVEKVTKEFFDLYCEKYHELREHLLTNEDFVAESEKCGFTAEQFAKKLMGQIVFLYFLQKKGWLGVGVWPTELTEKEYNNVFYTRGAQKRLIQEYLPQVYINRGDKYVLRSSALDVIPDDAEEMIANNLPKDKTKDWGTGSKTFLRTLFNYAKRRGGNFFDDYLEPLFYDTLNKNRGAMGYSPLLHCRIPFLSGGLFEPINGYQWEVSNFNIPDHIFSNKVGDDDRSADGILDIFDRYNFTMSEDEPMEREVAIDPEMLGKVFENLLDVTDRKSKGAFYTPREIVHYMCQESLINYLVDATGIAEDGVRDLILYGDFMKDEDTVKTIRVVDENGKAHMKFDYNRDMYISEEILSFKNNVNRLNDIDHALADIRVADPAVGSGAFPLGMLNEIVRARQCLTEYMALVVAKPAVSDAQASFFIRELRRERTAYDLKKYAIKNSIFAVDIEPSAVDIAQLRLWLSLVIDDEINPNASNMLEGHRNPLPLPNLESNILCGNSLIDEFEGVSLLNQSDLLGISRDGGQRDMATSAFEAVLPKLLETQDALFFCDDPAKKAQLIDEIESLKKMAIEPQLYAMSPEVRDRFEETKNMASRPFILWQLEFARVFRDKGGFDVIIGNPPYLKEIDYKEIFAPVYKTEFGKKYGEGKMNYWYFFFHKGMNILRKNGHLTFIAPNYFVAGSGASKLNDYIVNHCAIRRYVDFNKTKVFETADVQCMILVCEKGEMNIAPFKAYMFRQGVRREELKIVMSQLDSSDYVAVYEVDNQKRIMSADYKINFENVKYEEILNLIESSSSTEKLFKSTQGIVENPSCLNNKNISALGKTGISVSQFHVGDEVFVINKNNIENLHLSKNEAEFLREYHEPNEIKRYCCNDSFKNYLLYICRDNMEDITLYPNLKKHLEKYRPFMEMRRETQKGSNKWFHLHWPRKEELFMREKIVYPQMGAKPVFAYSDRPFYVNMSANIIYAIKDINLKVFTCILNSELAHFWLLHRAKNRGIGLDIAVSVIDKFPVNERILSSELLTSLAEEVIEVANQGGNYSELDVSINKVVYDLYGIPEKEQSIIKQYIVERTGEN